MMQLKHTFPSLMFYAGLLFVTSLELCHADPPSAIIDLANQTTSTGTLHRVLGSAGNGHFGVPVAGGFDIDGDGFKDSAFSAMRASPSGRPDAGQVHLVLGDGTINGTLDTAVNNPRIIQIIGDGQQENTGSEIWMDDVTGDGLGDLLIARQNYTASNNRPGAGALTILVGNSQLLSILGTNRILDLRNPPAGLNLFTINGAEAGDRLGIWMRTGDVDGDGIHDIVVGADQDDGLNNSEDHSGSVYLIRGGNHLNSNQTIDLASFGQTALSGQIIHILPPENSSEYHFGATCQIADLDGNGRAEVLASAALNRAGAELLPLAGGGPTHSQNGLPEGTLYIAWDNLIPTPPWTPGLTYRFGTNPDSETIINGATNNDVFGEELLGGLDYDNDNQADLFIGDLSGQGNGISTSGIGYVFYNAANLKGRNVDMQTPPGNLPFTQFHGGFIGGIAGDTAMHGDMDGDGIADLAFSAPHGAPLGRTNAGIIHIIHGQNGPWPAVIDLQTNNLPPASTVRITQIFGANGDRPNDTGDVLSYSGTAADINNDGRIDLITNEMVGNGTGFNGVDRGNLIVISGALITPAAELTSPQEGLWWNPLRSGSGFDIELTGNGDLFMIWYTYDEQQFARWYLASAPLNGTLWNADLYQFSWTGSQATPQLAGTVELNFQNPTLAQFNWTLNNQQGNETIEFFQFGSNPDQAETWYEPAMSGYGLTHVEQGNTQVDVLYFYDALGNPVWALADSQRFTSTVDMNIFTGTCPYCSLVTPTVQATGTIDASFQNIDTGLLSTAINLPPPYSGSWLIDNAMIINLSN